MDPVTVNEIARSQVSARWPTATLLGSAMAIALGFVAIFAIKYFTLNPDVFGFYWPRRGWLLLHIAGSIVGRSRGQGSCGSV